MHGRPDMMPWRDIVRPVSDADRQIVRAAQLVLRAPQTGEMDEATITRIRGLQALFRLPMTGYLDQATWNQINEMRWVEVEDAVHGETAQEVQR